MHLIFLSYYNKFHVYNIEHTSGERHIVRTPLVSWGYSRALKKLIYQYTFINWFYSLLWWHLILLCEKCLLLLEEIIFNGEKKKRRELSPHLSAGALVATDEKRGFQAVSLWPLPAAGQTSRLTLFLAHRPYVVSHLAIRANCLIIFSIPDLHRPYPEA